MSDIIEQAQALLAWAEGKEDEYTIVLVCRALIVRTEALREIAAHAEFRAHDEDDASCLRGQLVTIGEAARKALAEEP